MNQPSPYSADSTKAEPVFGCDHRVFCGLPRGHEGDHDTRDQQIATLAAQLADAEHRAAVGVARARVWAWRLEDYAVNECCGQDEWKRAGDALKAAEEALAALGVVEPDEWAEP
jgi:hypothetical protein